MTDNRNQCIDAIKKCILALGQGLKKQNKTKSIPATLKLKKKKKKCFVRKEEMKLQTVKRDYSEHAVDSTIQRGQTHIESLS